MAKMLLQNEINSMLGHQVKAIGCCGITDGVSITGIFESFKNGFAIVKVDYFGKKNSLPVLVNQHTLELKNGKCKHCANVISDAEAFNDECFSCGKKP